MENKEARLYYVDLLRIIAGILVIVIHISDPFLNLVTIFGGKTWWIANILNSFSRISVPLFIVLSGSILISRKNICGLKTFIKMRLSKILIPLLFWLVFYTYWNSVWFKEPIDTNKLISSVLSVKISHLYFLVIMSGLYIITPILSVFSKNSSLIYKKYLLLISLIPSMFLTFTNRFFPEGAYIANIYTLFFGYICFYYAGDFFRTKIISKSKILLLSLFFILIGFLNAFLNYITVVIDNSYVSILRAKNVNQYFFEPLSPFMVFMTLSIFIIFSNLNFGRFLNNIWVKKIIVNVSSSIFGIYLIHPLVIQLLESCLHWEIYNLVSPLWLFMLFKIILVFIISYIIVSVGKRIPLLKVVFGF
jgi:surface polysaccharide O-acyltransferase-like enzyme